MYTNSSLNSFKPYILQCTIFILCAICPFFVNAQTSILTGKVTDEKTKEAVQSAVVEVVGTSFKTNTDANGNYRLSNLPAGPIQVVVTNIVYTDKLFALTVTPGQILVVDIVLTQKTIDLQGIVITPRKGKAGTVNAVISETRNAKAVISGISKQQISLSQDNNAAQVVQRIPGVTIIENRFVMIRGLSERYNNVLINNVVAPSTEVDKRTFSFDLIPSSSIDRMLIFKSGSPENPGDFAGGIIQLYTNNLVEKNFTELSIGTGVRAGTSFEPFMQSRGGSLDLLGFDD